MTMQIGAANLFKSTAHCALSPLHVGPTLRHAKALLPLALPGRSASAQSGPPAFKVERERCDWHVAGWPERLLVIIISSWLTGQQRLHPWSPPVVMQAIAILQQTAPRPHAGPPCM